MGIRRRLSASFLVLCIALSQSYAVPAFGQDEPGARTETSTIKNAKKAALSAARKKMGSDILKLLDDGYIAEGESREVSVARFKEDKQYFAKDGYPGYNQAVKEKRYEDLIYAYIRLNEGYATSSIDGMVWEVTGRDENARLAAAYVGLNKLDGLASLPSVASIKLVTPPKVRKGSVTTEGDIAHKTAAVRSTYAQEGAGIRIGVISDGVDNMASAKSSGDLPSDLTVLSNTRGGDEGTAMLEIVYDMAPKASLYFHDNGENMIDFNAAVDELVSAGCKIIIDDLGWDEEAFFEDGVIGSHMASVMSSKDVVFVSAAGNEADVHYQGQFYDGGSGVHDFSRGSSDSKFLYVTLPSGEDLDVILQWDDRFGQSTNDYDLAIYNKTTGVKLSESTDTQDGSGDPLETIYYTNSTSSAQDIQIEVINYDAPQAKTLELFLYPSAGEVSSANIVAADSVYGHPAIPGVIAVAAINAKDPGYDTIEYYSSRGPVTIIDKTPRQKPDITALDNVSVTGAGDFDSPFAGTSASAPAVGAIVAQLWGAFPSMKGTEIRDAIYASAVDLGASGFDTTYGYGRADAMRSYEYLKVQSAPETPAETATDDTPSSAKAITSFVLTGRSANLDETSHTVSVTLPAGTDITSLAPTIGISDKASIIPASGAYKDFTKPVVYTVTAEDGSKQSYTVTVILASLQTPFQLPAGIVDGDIIQCKNSSDPFAVYIVKIIGSRAYIRHIVSLEIFNYYKHLRWENLKQVSSLDPFSLSGWVRVNTGINGSPQAGDKVWEINGDQTRHWINMTASQFLNHGGTDEAIYIINQGELNLYRQGPDIISL